MFFRRPFYVPTRVQSKQAEIAMQRLPTEGEMHPNDMAVCPVGKAARATVNKTVWGGQIRHPFGFHSKVSAIREKDGCDICRRYWRGSWDV